MKKMKKLSALIVALVMILVMGFTALAANNGTITVTEAKKDKVYDLYRVFDMTRNDKSETVAYTINSDWENFFNTDGAEYIVDVNTGNLTPITVNGAVKYINITDSITDSNVAEFAQDALAYAANKNAVATEIANSETVVFNNLELGYYLVYPQGATDIKDTYASICSLTSTNPDVEVVVKAEYPTIEKTDNKVSADVGDTVTYTLTGKVPDTTGYEDYLYKITDEMTDGLTFNGVTSITVKVGNSTLNENYTATLLKDENGNEKNGFVLNIDVMKLQENSGEIITVTYTATVNANAVTQVEENKVTLTYSNDPQKWEDGTTTPPDIEKVYSAKIVINKYDANDETIKLSGAEFVLKNSAGKYYATASNATIAGDEQVAEADKWVVEWVDNESDALHVVTDEDGTAEFPGLAVGNYELVETKAPEGYNLLVAPEPVDIQEAENGEAPTAVELIQYADVANNSGTLLPGTGGIGTTMFYVIGGVLVLAAMALVALKSRMKTED